MHSNSINVKGRKSQLLGKFIYRYCQRNYPDLLSLNKDYPGINFLHAGMNCLDAKDGHKLIAMTQAIDASARKTIEHFLPFWVERLEKMKLKTR